MKRFLVFATCFVLSFSLVCHAEESKMSSLSLIDLASSYESNIVYFLCGDSWEIPYESSEFTPDEPLGVYVNSEATLELSDKYDMYKYLLDQSMILDSGVSVEDAEVYALTTKEELQLSNVEFNYYYNYKSDYLIQWFSISWISGNITSGYVIWNEYGYVYEAVVL